MSSFAAKSVVITGASSGLGAALAGAFSAEGARLTLFSRREDALERVADSCRAAGAEVATVTGDVALPEDCRRLMEAAVERHGGIDVVIANAGVSMWARFEDVTDLSVFRRLMETNYLGTVHCLHYGLPHLRARGGSFVVISSIQGRIGVPLHTGYGASKHAVQGFVAALRTELSGTGVHILSVMPHWLRGTGLRQNAFTGTGEPVGGGTARHSRESIDLEACARAVLKAVRKRKRELVIPWKLKLLPWLLLLSPGAVERMVRRAVDVQVGSRNGE
jgi:short-subunit dehydrogenase